MTKRLLVALAVGAAGCDLSAGGSDFGLDGAPLEPTDGSRPDAPATDASVADGALPDASRDGGSPDAAFVPPEIDGQLTINEFMTGNALSLRDEANNAGDWIELYNPTDQSLSLQGYFVTDLLSEPRKATLGDLSIPAGGYLLLWADDHPELGAQHLGFKLTEAGGELGLARPDGSYIDRVTYGAQAVDFSSARTPDGSDRWETVWNITPRASNGPGDGAPMGLEVAGQPPENVPAAPDLSEEILGYDQIPALAIQVAPADVAALEAEPDEYVPATLMYRGRSYGPVGLRLKGQNSFLPFSQKPALRINMDEYIDKARFWGLKDLTLNNMSGDFSMMHERLGYWLMRHAGVPASRANHLLLTINGQFYGLYANVETVKKGMLGRWFSDNAGPLFEATDVDFAERYIAAYELESGPDDRGLLRGLAGALTLASADEAIATAGAFADMNAFLRYWAVCSVIAQFDAFPYSLPGDDYFVYADPVSQRLAFLPWGMDETFYSGQLDVVTTTSSVFARRCKESPGCFNAYVRQTWEVLDLAERLDLAGERDRVIAQIAPYVAMDTRKPYTAQQVHDSQAALYWFIAERRANLGTMLPPP